MFSIHPVSTRGWIEEPNNIWGAILRSLYKEIMNPNAPQYYPARPYISKEIIMRAGLLLYNMMC